MGTSIRAVMVVAAWSAALAVGSLTSPGISSAAECGPGTFLDPATNMCLAAPPPPAPPPPAADP